ncbi:hypothetical protein G8A07_04440 [Roseateles sp. DAIF2]|uniref:Tc toxin subunit A-related protein n=1 Tax=Roseateles sp. DAIF2 TaxID=2714952 RepID=UPI0018A32F90|nr:neuraminidase-like domain-containing protein [Roseateles sp. DAIF2]QPF72250.1 hypothetical protein G8A07_04440 [Roseateles sp. DAIF2]
MQLRGRPLKFGDTGADVALLHQELLSLGLDIAADERAPQGFGTTTRAAVEFIQETFVGELQQLHWHGERGVVDVPTATLLGRVVARRNVKETREPTNLVTGYVWDSFGACPGATIHLLDHSARGLRSLGSARTTDDGRLRFAFDWAHTLQQPNLTFRVTDSQGRERTVTALFVRRGDSEAAVERVAPTPDAPLVLLNSAPRVQVRLYVARAPGESDVSEFEEVEARLAPALHSFTYEQLEEGEGRFQLSLLAAETGVVQPLIERLVASAKASRIAASQNHDIPVATFYGLEHAGLPVDLASLARQPRAVLMNGLRAAIDAAIIPKSLTERLEHHVDELLAAATAHALRSTESGRPSGEAWMALTRLSQDQQARLLRALTDSDVPNDEMWIRLRGDSSFGAEAIKRAEVVMRLAVFSEENLPLVKLLLEDRSLRIDSAEDIARLDASTMRSLIDRAGVPPSLLVEGREPEGVRDRYAQRLVQFAQKAWPTAAVEALVERQHTRIGVDLAAARWLEAARRAAERGAIPSFDLRVTNIDRFLSEHGAHVGFSAENVDRLRADLKRLQRTLVVADEPAHMEALLSRGLDSALSVARVPASVFVSENEAVFGKDVAARIYERATQINLAHFYVHLAVLESLKGAGPMVLKSGTAPIVLADVVKIIPGYENLFGEFSLCACDDCESVLSPSAYFVDLLQFLSRSGKNAAGRTPLDVLLRRRPDLEHILLTCANSNTPLPAIDLVNEILETIVVVGKVDASAAHDTGSATAEELAANPQFTLELARDTLSAALFPIRLPFDLRLETVRAFLTSLLTSRYEVMSTLRQDALLAAPSLVTEEAIAAEVLLLSKLDFELITGMDYAGAGAPVGTLEDLYGLDAASVAPALAAGAEGNAVRVLQQKLNTAGAAPPLQITGQLDATTQAAVGAFQAGAGLPSTGIPDAATWTALDGIAPDMGPGLVSWVTEFMRRTERPYTDLIALCETRTFNPLATSIAALGPTKVTWADVAALAASGFAAPNANIVAGAGVLGLVVADFVAWLKERFDGLAAGIVIESLGNDCDLGDARLRRIDGDTVPAETFVAINRFLRLSARTGLSIPDLDVALAAFAGIGIGGTTDANMPLSLAALLRLRERLRLTLPELVVLLGDLQTGAQSLYTQLFLNRAALALDGSFTLAFDGSGLALVAEPIDKHVPALLAAFRVTDEDLGRIRQDAGLAAAGSSLSVENLARLYRYAVLARALEVEVADVISMRALSAPDPLQAVASQPLRLEQLVRDFDTVSSTNLPIAAVDQLLRHLARTGSGESVPDTLALLAATLHDDQIDLAADIGSEPGMPVDRFRILLARLVGTEAVDRFLGITSGSATFTATYTKTPTPAQGAVFAPNITFEPAQQLIRFSRVAMPAGSVVTLGALTDAEKATLQAAAGADADLLDAVGVLHARPRKALDDVLAGVAGGPAIAAKLLATGAGALTVEGKLHFIVEALLPYVREALARSIIKQKLLPFSGLEAPALAALLEDTGLATAPGSADALVVPLRDLEKAGWAAEFFTSTTLTGAPLATAEDPVLDYAGAGGDFGQASPVGSVRWSAHLLPRSPAAVVFEVTTNGTPALFWSGVAVPAVNTGQLWRFDARTVQARERVEVTLEWRRTGPDPAMLRLAWINGTEPRGPLPARLLVPAPAFAAATAALTRFDKASRLLRSTRLDPALLKHAVANPASFSGFKIDALPLARTPATAAAIDAAAPPLLRGLLRLTELARLSERLRGGSDALIGILTAPSVADAGNLMTTAIGANAADVSLLLGAGGFAAALSDIIDGRALLRVNAATSLVRRVGVAGVDLLAWATKPGDAAQTEAVKRATRARFDEADWLQLSTGLNDPLRERWRDALASWLLPRLGLTNRDQLFELLLLDTEVGSCVKSSRVLNGIKAVQNFVLRVQLNLENLGALHQDTVLPTAIDPQVWEAKKYFRVQGAARSVLLYPENYMKGLQRGDRSPLFDRFINDLGQAELSEEGIEAVFLTYLKGLDAVARLEICGAWAQGYDAGSAREVDLVHMIGRSTLGAPYSFHYRRLENDERWTPWERVPIDVDTVHDGKVEGAHVIPVIWNRRLYVFWPILEVKPNPTAGGQNPLREPQAHKDWRKAHDQWEAAHAKWEKDMQQWQADKKAWEDNNAAHGRSLFWEVPPPKEPAEPLEPDNTEAIRPQDTHMELRIAWCEFFDGRWSAKEVSSLVLSSSNVHPEQYVFSAMPTYDGKLYVEFICRHWVVQWVPNPGPGGGFMRIENTSAAQSVDRGSFEFSGVNGRLRAAGTVLGVPPGQSGDLWVIQPDNTRPVFNTFELQSGASGLTFNVGDYLPLNARVLPTSIVNARRVSLPALTRSPTTYRVTPPHHYPQYVLQGPCFYQDFNRNYIVTRVQRFVRTPFEYVAKPKVPLAPSGVKLTDVLVTDVRPGDAPSPLLERQKRIYGAAAAQQPQFPLSGAMPVSKRIPASEFVLHDAPYTIAEIGAREKWGSDASILDRKIIDFMARDYLLFRNLFHPHVADFIRLLNQGGVEALLATSTQRLSNDGGGNRFQIEYKPTWRVTMPYPLEEVDFGNGAYADYNWEVFYHCPMLMADVSEAAGLFGVTERCLRFVLDPTAGNLTTAPGGSPAEYWQFLPFQLAGKPPRIQDLLKALSSTDPAKLALKAQATAQIVAWESDPFNPFLIGRLRIGAFQKHVVIRWIQHLVLRAETLVRSERPEPINEAVQILVFAANLLGPRPERIPPRARRKPQTYATLKGALDRFSNALVLLENEFPFSVPFATSGTPPGGGLLGMSEALYFCIPSNPLLESLWDRIAQLLFQIRHCMNIEGVVRDLPLYEPPIDPALLVAARAQGLDLASVLADLGAPLPQQRFDVCLEQANQAVEDVRRLGQDLRAILEARDGEALALRRAQQDVALMRHQIRQVKLREVDQAKAQIHVLEEAQHLLETVRIPYFTRQLGLSEPSPNGVIADAHVLLNSSELARIESLGRARSILAEASLYSMNAKMMSAIPTMMTGTAGISSPVLEVYLGGHMLSLGLEAFAQSKTNNAADATHQATLAEIRAQVERRAEEWALQLSSAVGEHEHGEKQLIAARIALDLANLQLQSHDQDTDFAQERLEFLENKATALAHHDWLKQEVGFLLGQYYQLAFDLCKRVQQVYRFDTGDGSATFVEYGYFDKAHNGLLSGERLALALRKMARAYRDQERYEFDLSKPISLAQCDPMALISLRATGACEFNLPEALFDADFPGHYMRRIRSVSVTIPCVTGPYVNVNATLTLLNSRVRTSNSLSPAYAEQPDDPRFTYNQGVVRSIATSHAQEDSGLAPDRSRTRLDPFEGFGAISRWRLEMPLDTNALDPMTVADVIIRVDYRARGGGEPLQDAVRKTSLQPPRKGLARLFSLRHEFANAWNRGLRPADATATESIFEADIDVAHFPYLLRTRGPKATELALMLQVDDIAAYQGGTALQADVVLTPLTNGVPSGPPVSQAVTFQSLPTRLGGLPMARVQLAGKAPVRLQVKAKSADVSLIAPRFVEKTGAGADLRHRLNSLTVRDLSIVLSYDTQV